MNKIITAGCMALAAAAVLAMPNKRELAKAKPLVEAMTKADLAAYKAGEKIAQKVALEHLVLAQKAENEAEKYLLLQGAFKLYARCGEYDLAADAIQIMKRDVKDVPPEVIAEIVGDELRYVADGKAPRLVAMLKEAKAKSVVEKSVASFAASTAKPRPQGALLARQKDMEDTTHLQATIGDYTWSYRIENGEATIEAMKNGEFCCAVTPVPTGRVAIPATLGGVKVAAIGTDAFKQCDKLESVELPMGLARIGEHAFHATGVKSMSIPASVTNIACAAFQSCENLKTFAVDANNSVYSSRNGLLCSKDGLVLYAGVIGDVIVPEGVEHFGVCAFMYLNGLKSLTIPASVKDITSYGIHACRELESVTMLGERPSVPGSVLWGCDKAKVYVPVDAKSWAGMKTWQNRTLVFGPKWNYEVKNGEIVLGGKGRTAVPTAMKGDLVIPATIDGKPVRKIGCRAFRDCQALTSVTIPEGVTSFEGEAFRNCSELTTVNVPSSVTNVHASAFIDCKAFAKFSVDPRNLVYCSKNDMLCTKDGSKVVFGVIGDVTIPDGVESIGIHAFNGFRGLRSVKIPKSVKVIGGDAFRNCGMLKSAEIPCGVQTIGEGAARWGWGCLWRPAFIGTAGVDCQNQGGGGWLFPDPRHSRRTIERSR